MKAKLAITIDENILKSIKELSKADGRTVSNYINKVLKDYLRSLNK